MQCVIFIIIIWVKYDPNGRGVYTYLPPPPRYAPGAEGYRMAGYLCKAWLHSCWQVIAVCSYVRRGTGINPCSRSANVYPAVFANHRQTRAFGDWAVSYT